MCSAQAAGNKFCNIGVLPMNNKPVKVIDDVVKFSFIIISAPVLYELRPIIIYYLI